MLELSHREWSSAIKKKNLGNCINFVHTSMFMFGNFTALEFISHIHLFTSILRLPIAIECYWVQKEKLWLNERI